MHVWPTLLLFYSIVVNTNRESGLTLVLPVICQDFVGCIATLFYLVSTLKPFFKKKILIYCLFRGCLFFSMRNCDLGGSMTLVWPLMLTLILTVTLALIVDGTNGQFPFCAQPEIVQRAALKISQGCASAYQLFYSILSAIFHKFLCMNTQLNLTVMQESEVSKTK